MIQTIEVKVSFKDADSVELAAAICIIDASNIKRVKPSDITDACQRAVAHCTDELKETLDKS